MTHKNQTIPASTRLSEQTSGLSLWDIMPKAQHDQQGYVIIQQQLFNQVPLQHVFPPADGNQTIFSVSSSVLTQILELTKAQPTI